MARRLDTADSCSAVEREEFAALMADFEPFEAAPDLAVAVSGGADSMALAVLLQDWVETRRGRLEALVVDHGLRPGSRREARWTLDQLSQLGLAGRRLTWRGEKPKSNVQARARAARYALLTECCARRGILHLALAHHRDDQAETLLMRLGRGSGLEGLAGMAPVSEAQDVRLIRPLLALPKARLIATLQARGLTWVEDPTNENLDHTRIRLRRLLSGSAAHDLPPARLAMAADHLGRSRTLLGASLNQGLSEAVNVYPAGYAELDIEALRGVGEDLVLRALARVLTTIGGEDYPPRFERLQGLAGRVFLTDFRGATLGGCRVLRKRGQLLVVREAARMPRTRLEPGQSLIWDQRFDVRLGRRTAPQRSTLTLRPLGSDGSAAVRKYVGKSKAWLSLAGPARQALPALFDRHGPLEVPHLGYRRGARRGHYLAKCLFRPKNSLTNAGFTVA